MSFVSKLNYGYLAAVIAIICWSTSATFGGLLATELSFFSIVFGLQVVALISLLPFVHEDINNLIHSQKIRQLSAEFKKQICFYIAIFSLLLTLYQLFFYYALTSEVRIYANLANYFWPIILYVFMHSVFSLTNRKANVFDLLLLALGFMGATSLVWDIPRISSTVNNFDAYIGLICGLVAAFCAAAYMTCSTKISMLMKAVDVTLNMTTLYFVAMLLSILCMAVVGYSQGLFEFPKTYWGYMYVIWLGIFTVAIAQTTWSYALVAGNPGNLSIFSYLIPVFSTILQVAILGDEITTSILFGMTFIIVASILTSEIFRNFIPETAASVAFMYVGFANYFQITTLQNYKFEIVDGFSIQLFSILAAFFLSRQWQRSKENKELMFEWRAQVLTLADIANDKSVDKNGNYTNNTKEVLKLIDLKLINLMRSIIDIDQARDKRSILIAKNEYNFAERDLLTQLRKVLYSSKVNSVTRRNQFDLASSKLSSLSSLWMVQKMDRTTRGDISIIISLGLVACALYISTILGSQERGIIGMFIVSAVVYIVFRIMEFNVKPVLSTITDLESFQLNFLANSENVYLGDITTLKLNRASLPMEKQIEILNDDKKLFQFHSSDRKNPLEAVANTRKYAVAFLMAGPLLSLIINLF